MNVRFYVDPETGDPHIYNHGIDEEEVIDFSQALGKIVQGGKVRAWQVEGHEPDVICG
jgi:hypothetical protein